MPYYVVNAGRGRSTHIMKSKSPSIPGVGTFLFSNIVGFGGGTVKYTLCGLSATRYVNVFTPSEASCRECRKRWQLESTQAVNSQVLPVPAPEVLILVKQGRKIQAIKRYRELNPGIGLKQAKDVIDGL
jgi:hypothetical protein